MNPEQSRRVDAALDQLRSLQRPNPHQPVLLDTLGSTARVAHLEETAATTEIKPARRGIRRNWARSGTTAVAAGSALHEEFEKDGHRQRQAAAKRSS